MNSTGRSVRLLTAVILIGVAGCAAELSGQPSWFALGPEVYHEQNRFKVQKELLSFDSGPRWFMCFPRKVSKAEFEAEVQRRAAQGNHFSMEEPLSGEEYALPVELPMPKGLGDLPTTDQGASLALAIEPTPSRRVLRFILTLRAEGRAVQREVQHRWTNTLPVLFAFYADGKAVHREPEGLDMMGGINYLIMLVEKGRERRWVVNVDADSIKPLLADRPPRMLHVVAAFSDRQHEGYMPGAARFSDVLADSRLEGPQILIRSNVVGLRRDGEKWSVVE